MSKLVNKKKEKKLVWVKKIIIYTSLRTSGLEYTLRLD